jgi:peptide/nickel transport system permease protein
MRRLIITRIVSMFGVLALLTVAIFLIQNIVPSDPVRVYFGRNATPEQLEAKRHELGYDKPLPAQYVSFLGRLVQLDLGDSLRTRRAVTTDLADFIPATMELAFAGAVVAGVLGVALGLLGTRRGLGTGAVRTISVMGSSAPPFFIGILGILLLYRRLDWLPPGGRTDNTSEATSTGFILFGRMARFDLPGVWDAVRHLIMPATALALSPAVAIGRTLRGSLRDVLRDDKIRTARVKGLSERAVLVRHGLRNASGPALSMAGLQMGLLLAGVIVVEVVFSWPGLGLYLDQSIDRADFPAIIGVVIVLGTAYVVINTIVDLLQLVADPRLRSPR